MLLDCFRSAARRLGDSPGSGFSYHPFEFSFPQLRAHLLIRKADLQNVKSFLDDLSYDFEAGRTASINCVKLRVPIQVERAIIKIDDVHCRDAMGISRRSLGGFGLMSFETKMQPSPKPGRPFPTTKRLLPDPRAWPN
jgi:hypothetical protein